MNKIQFLFFICTLYTSFVGAQVRDFTFVEELMHNKKYALAQSYLRSVDQESLFDYEIDRNQYYIAVCAVELFNEDANFQLIKYLNSFPEGSYVNEVYFKLGNLYFREKNYDQAIIEYNNVDPMVLSEKSSNMYYFRYGYSALLTKEYMTAKSCFFQLQDVSFEFKELTQYYISHIHYLESNYAMALKGFQSLENTPGISGIVKYYIAQIYYLQARNQELLDYGLPILDNSKNKRFPEIARLIGDSYYYLGEFKKSISYFNIYREATERSFNRFDKYQLAYSYYKTQDFDNAIGFFEEVLNESDSLSQYAAYYLANSYMKLNKKNYALNAYRHAASFQFDSEIKESSEFNYVKLVYDQGGAYEDVLEVLNTFLSTYPNSKYLSLIESYLLRAYISSNKYTEALNALDELSELNYEQQTAYQRLAYFRGLELFNNQQKETAIKLFNKSLRYPLSSIYKSLSLYWKGESYYSLGDFNNAAKQFQEFVYSPGAFQLSEYKSVHYSLAYSYYQQQNYSQAIKWFRKHTSISKDFNKINDSYIRLGDSYFLIKKYEEAIESYQAQDSASADFDYSLYQQSVCYGLIADRFNQTNTLHKIINDYSSSVYIADAKYDLGNIYLAENFSQKGFTLLQEVVDQHPFSSLVKKALLKLGIYYYNSDNPEESIINFKRVIEDYPGTIESSEALEGLKNVYIDLGKIKSYFNYIQQLSGVSVSNSTQDSITFQVAETLFIQGNKEKSILAFSDYLNTFENGIFRLLAHFYKGEALYFLDRKKESLNEYLIVLEFKQNQYTERALLRAARMEFENQDFSISAFHYQKILQQTNSKELKKESLINLLDCYIALDDTLQILSFANSIFKIDNLNNDLKIKVSLILANSDFEKSEYYSAKKYYQWISSVSTTLSGSEAKYKLAYIYFLEDEFEKCEAQIFDLAENFKNDHYIAKGFILLADLYLYKGDIFQAKATLESVIMNHEGTDLVRMAKEKKKSIVESENEKNKNQKESEIILDLLKDMQIDFEEIMEEEIMEEEIIE